MKHRSLILTVIVALITTFLGVSHPALMSPLKAPCQSATVMIPGGFGQYTTPSFTHHVNDNLVVTVTGAANITIAADDGAGNYSAVTNSLAHTYTSNATQTVKIINGNAGSVTITYTITLNGGCSTGLFGGGDGSVSSFNFTDGRVNSHDGAETTAVYCESDGGVTVYAVVRSVGHLAFKATKAEVDAVPVKPEHNTLIKSGLGISLYRLTTGELQINAPHNYVFIWDGCSIDS